MTVINEYFSFSREQYTKIAVGIFDEEVNERVPE